MRVSLAFGVAMLLGKTAAYLMTHSAAIFSDAAESVIHVIAVGFAILQPSPQRAAGIRITFSTATSESPFSLPDLKAR